jgi:hypothetical protein
MAEVTTPFEPPSQSLTHCPADGQNLSYCLFTIAAAACSWQTLTSLTRRTIYGSLKDSEIQVEGSILTFMTINCYNAQPASLLQVRVILPARISSSFIILLAFKLKLINQAVLQFLLGVNMTLLHEAAVLCKPGNLDVTQRSLVDRVGQLQVGLQVCTRTGTGTQFNLPVNAT